MIGQIIGAENFDIGHIGLGVNGGGIAASASSAGTTRRAAAPASRTPDGDFYAIDYVAHEMGHQFGGNHTFNGSAVNCGGNGERLRSVEPGSAPR